MKLRLSRADLATHEGCIRPNNRRQKSRQVLKWAAVVLLVLFVIYGVIAVFSLDLALLLLIPTVICGICAFLYRLIRGHSLKCSVYWGFVGGIWLAWSVVANL